MNYYLQMASILMDGDHFWITVLVPAALSIFALWVYRESWLNPRTAAAVAAGAVLTWVCSFWTVDTELTALHLVPVTGILLLVLNRAQLGQCNDVRAAARIASGNAAWTWVTLLLVDSIEAARADVLPIFIGGASWMDMLVLGPSAIYLASLVSWAENRIKNRPNVAAAA